MNRTIWITTGALLALVLAGVIATAQTASLSGEAIGDIRTLANIHAVGDSTAAGNMRTSGTATAAQFVGGGAGLTGLDAGDISAGTLAQARGGTGVTTDFTAGSVIFDNGTGFAQDNSSIYFNDSKNRLGIGTNSIGGQYDGALVIQGGDDAGNKVITFRDASSTLKAWIGVQAVTSTYVTGAAIGDTSIRAQQDLWIASNAFANPTLKLTGTTTEAKGLLRTDNGTNGTNDTATGAGDLYVEDSGEFDGDMVVAKRSAHGDRTNITVSANSQTATITSSYHLLTASTATTAYTDLRLSDGAYTGQTLVLEVSASSGSVALVDNAATNNTNLSAAFTMGDDDTCSLIWNGTDWLETGRSNN